MIYGQVSLNHFISKCDIVQWGSCQKVISYLCVDLKTGEFCELVKFCDFSLIGWLTVLPAWYQDENLWRLTFELWDLIVQCMCLISVVVGTWW